MKGFKDPKIQFMIITSSETPNGKRFRSTKTLKDNMKEVGTLKSSRLMWNYDGSKLYKVKYRVNYSLIEVSLEDESPDNLPKNPNPNKLQ